MRDADQVDFSLVVPVFKNEANIPELIEAIDSLMATSLTGKNEAVFVIDGSPDRSCELLLERLPKQTWSSQLVTHTRNFGAFAAVRTGLSVARGKSMAVMAADLQEPPELFAEFSEILARNEADVVFGQRLKRGDGPASSAASKLFWKLYRRLIFPEMPEGGIDVFAINGRVKDVILSMSEPNSSLIAQLWWVGFRRKLVPYVRRPRSSGQSAWTSRKKLAYMIDSFVSFTDLPIMMLLGLGLFGLVVSGAAGLVVLVGRLGGWITQAGYAPIMLLIVFVSSVLLLSQAILGLYLWRTFENTKQRPPAIIAEHVSFDGTDPNKRG